MKYSVTVKCCCGEQVVFWNTKKHKCEFCDTLMELTMPEWVKVLVQVKHVGRRLYLKGLKNYPVPLAFVLSDMGE
jgi:hypothetical protein